MILKNLAFLLLSICFFSCTDTKDSSDPEIHVTKRSAFSIRNSQRSGFGYTDTSGRLYVCYTVTTTITNDSTIPMRLVIDFPKEKDPDSLKTPVFLFPRKQLNPKTELTAVTQQLDPGMSHELKWFLDRLPENTVSFDTVLNAKGSCVLAFGVLNYVKKAEPYAISLKASDNDLSLSFDRITPVEHNLVPCGQIVFTEKK